MKPFFDHLQLVRKAKMKLSRPHPENEIQDVPLDPVALEQHRSATASPIQPSLLQASEGSMATATKTPSILSKFKQSPKAIMKKLASSRTENKMQAMSSVQHDSTLPSINQPSSPRTPEQPMVTPGRRGFIPKSKVITKLKKLLRKRKPVPICKENISNPIPLLPTQAAQSMAEAAESSNVNSKFELINRIKKFIPKRKPVRISKANISNPIPLSPSQISGQSMAAAVESSNVPLKSKLINKVKKLIPKRKPARILKENISNPIPQSFRQDIEWPLVTAPENPSFIRKLISQAKKRFLSSREEYEMQNVFTERAVPEQLGSPFSSPFQVPSPPVSRRRTVTADRLPSFHRKRKHVRIRGTKVAYPIRLRSEVSGRPTVPAASSQGLFRGFFRKLKRVRSFEETISNPVQLLSIRQHGHAIIATRRKPSFFRKFKSIHRLKKEKPSRSHEGYELQDLFPRQAASGQVSASMRPPKTTGQSRNNGAKKPTFFSRTIGRLHKTMQSRKIAAKKPSFSPKIFGKLQKMNPCAAQQQDEPEDNRPDPTLDFGANWEIGSLSELLTEVATGRPAPAPSVQQARSTASSSVHGRQTRPGPFGFAPIVRPALSDRSDMSDRQTIVSTEISTDDSDLPPDHPKAKGRRCKEDVEDDEDEDEDSDVDPTLFYVEDPVDTEAAAERSTLARQLRRSIIPMNALQRRWAEEAREMLQDHLDRAEERREEQRRLNENRVRAQELADIEALSADLSNHPFALDSLVGRDPVTGALRRRASFHGILLAGGDRRPFDDTTARTDEIPQGAQIEDIDDNQDHDHVDDHAAERWSEPFELEVLIGCDPGERDIGPEAPLVNTSNVDQPLQPPAGSDGETSSTSSVGQESCSSDEFEGIAFNTPTNGEEWQVPAVVDLPYLMTRLRMVARARSQEDTLPAWVTRWRRYRLRQSWTICSHEVLLPYFVEEGLPDRACDRCGRVTRVLWSCASDTPDFSAYNPAEQPRRDVSILPQWVQRAIAAGEYTPEQVERLINDRIRVIQVAAWDRVRLSRYVRSPSRENEEWLALASAREVRSVSPREPCRLIQCGACFNVGDDDERTRGRIDQVVSEPYQDPPQIPEYLSRPISNAAVLQAGGSRLSS